MMERKEWLESLKVGDKVIVLRSQYSTTIREIGFVTKVTKQYLIIDDSKYRKSDGNYVTRDTWAHANWIEEVTEEHLFLIKKQKSRSKIYGFISDIAKLQNNICNITDIDELTTIERYLYFVRAQLSKKVGK